jgi:hypothetical protein
MGLATNSADAERIAQMAFLMVLLPIDLTREVSFNVRQPDAAISSSKINLPDSGCS